MRSLALVSLTLAAACSLGGADDADCDGLPTAEDCDDNDPASLGLADDADCDGALPGADCDDNDPSVGDIANDADWDGSRTVDDCDDSDDSDPTTYPGAVEGPDNHWYDPACDGTVSPVEEVSFHLTATLNGQEFGASVAAAGDVDGDGLEDLLVGITNHNDTSWADGAAALFYGATLAANPTLTLDDADVLLLGIDFNEQVGIGVGSAGDLDGDGLDDLIVGSKYMDTSVRLNVRGYYVVRASSLPTSGSSMSLANADLLIEGIHYGGTTGEAITHGDYDGDGLDDVVVSTYDLGVADHVGIFWGATIPWNTSMLLDTADTLMVTSPANDAFGASLATMPDLDGDGYDELVVTAPRQASAFASTAGTVALWDGHDLPTTPGTSITATASPVRLVGSLFGGRFGETSAWPTISRGTGSPTSSWASPATPTRPAARSSSRAAT